jgi:exopolyphosphatase/guanosine-5'-triphosphate,3'-diphosphate pyrophosphatase
VSDELRGADLEAVRRQLGREPTTPFSVIARCTGGHPLVIRNRPLDAAGDPFPTIYWLTCPDAVRAVSRLESEGRIASLNDRYDTHQEFRDAVDRAHAAYAAEREEVLPGAGAWGGVGGTRRKIKCLHAHYAYHLAGGEDIVGRWTAERVEPVHPTEPGGRVAAIDQGTNSTRLLVLEPGGPGEDPLELSRDMRITRLGKAVDRTGRLDRDSIGRAVDAVARFARRARALHAERIRLGATSAVRDASNRQEFLGPLRELIGAEPEVIEGEQEAALSFLGGTRGLDPSRGPFLLVDIGGGSTEFVVGSRPDVAEHAISTRMGSVRLTERLIRHDPPAVGELDALARGIGDVLDEVQPSVPVGDARTLIAVAGTATTLQAIALGLDRYDPERIHRTWLALADAERIQKDLVLMTTPQRAALPVMAPGRGDVIVAGAAILTTAMRRFGFDRALVSETDILDGLAFEMLDIR